MIEIEYKFEVKNLEEILKKCEVLGVKFGVKKFEKTVMYDNKSNLMQETDGRIRLRKTLDAEKENETCTISYKKPLGNKLGEPKREIELETGVENFEIMDELLRKMEFQPASSYEKYRTKTEFDSVVLTVDEYPFTTFLELEGEEENINILAEKLGLDVKNHLNKPADTLFNIWRKEQGLPEKMHMNFADFDK